MQRRASGDGVSKSVGDETRACEREVGCYGVSMSEAVPSERPEPSPFEKMSALATRVLSVPKSEVDKREAKWREDRAMSISRKKPKPGFTQAD